MWMQLGLGPRETVRLRISFTLRGVRRWYLAGLITPCVSLGGSSPSPATRRLFVLFFNNKDESKIKISESCVNKHVGELNSQFGTCWITNGIVNKKIKKSEQPPVEWNYGRVV